MELNTTQSILRADDLGIKLFDVPPVGFRPKTASAKDLDSFGVLQRPTSDTSLEYRVLWDRMYSGGFKPVLPQFQRRAVKTRILALGSAPQTRAVTQAALPGPVQFSNWTGIAIARRQDDTPVTQISATWSVPNLNVPSYVADGVTCINSIWIGIDGFSPPESDILQAGVDLLATRQASAVTAEIRPWWEWWKGDSFYFSNFPISPGDVISCTITCTPGGSTGTVNMSNAINGNHISLPVPAPQGTKLIGNCAEWIVERQTADATSTVYTELAEFGSVFFDNAFAATTTLPTPQQTLLPGAGTLIDMIATESTTVLASPTLLGRSTLRIDRR